MKPKPFDVAIFAGCVLAMGMTVVFQEMDGRSSGYDGNPFTAMGRVWRKFLGTDRRDRVVCVFPERVIRDTANLVPLVLRDGAAQRRLPLAQAGAFERTPSRLSLDTRRALMLEFPADARSRACEFREPAVRLTNGEEIDGGVEAGRRKTIRTFDYSAQ